MNEQKAGMQSEDTQEADVVIAGAGPVGLMCAYLGQLCGLRTVIVDKSSGPIEVGRADAMNARTLQLLEVAGLFDALYPLGKTCNTSSVWANGGFVSRQSTWWEQLEGCLHKHFLMLGQAYVERLLDARLTGLSAPVLRNTSVVDVELVEGGCVTTLSNGDRIASRFVIGADGPRSFVRERFQIPFDIVRPQIILAVLDGVIETDFPKVPEIIVFQAETSDVAWIPREGNVDRFYVRMDTHDFTFEDAMEKIHRAIQPHALRFSQVEWFSQFSVKESVAEKFSVADRIFLAGDACHIHSVNGGQGLNTGLADAFNLMWKLHQVLKFKAPVSLLQSYEAERRPVAQSVIESSGALVRSTKFSEQGTHAQDYVRIVQQRSGNITGMGIRYGTEGLKGTRLFDQVINQVIDQVIEQRSSQTRLYSLLDYTHHTLLVFSDDELTVQVPAHVKVLQVRSRPGSGPYWTEKAPFGQAYLVRPDSYIQAAGSTAQLDSLLSEVW